MVLVVCSQCGNAVSDRATACPKCANPMSNYTTCSDCGTRAPAAMQSCQQCGNPFEAPSVVRSASTGVSSAILRSNTDNFVLGEPEAVEYAGFWRRAIALVIDAIVVSVVGAVIGFLIGFVLGLLFGQRATPVISVVTGLLGWVGGTLYYPLMESSTNQATLGKQMLGIIVTDDNGQRISLGRAFGRYLAKGLSLVTLLIGYLMAGFTTRRQALHDMVAGTLVVVGKPVAN